jgi:hypothetical protein
MVIESASVEAPARPTQNARLDSGLSDLNIPIHYNEPGIPFHRKDLYDENIVDNEPAFGIPFKRDWEDQYQEPARGFETRNLHSATVSQGYRAIKPRDQLPYTRPKMTDQEKHTDVRRRNTESARRYGQARLSSSDPAKKRKLLARAKRLKCWLLDAVSLSKKSPNERSFIMQNAQEAVVSSTTAENL